MILFCKTTKILSYFYHNNFNEKVKRIKYCWAIGHLEYNHLNHTRFHICPWIQWYAFDSIIRSRLVEVILWFNTDLLLHACPTWRLAQKCLESVIISLSVGKLPAGNQTLITGVWTQHANHCTMAILPVGLYL